MTFSLGGPATVGRPPKAQDVIPSTSILTEPESTRDFVRKLNHLVATRPGQADRAIRAVRAATVLKDLLTVIETCLQQSRDVFAYVNQAVEAHFANESCPSLLPNP